MRHGVKLKKLGRDHSHRKALIANMIKSFVKNEKMITTLEKAKALRPFIEKMITKAKVDSTANRRLLFSRLECKKTTAKLFDDLAKRYETRPGGYTRIYKLYNRKGDDANMALIELVEETMVAKKKAKSAPKKTLKAQVEPAKEVENKIVDSSEEVADQAPQEETDSTPKSSENQ